MSFASELRRLRKGTGLNQTKFARKVGYNKNTICDWEHGNTIPRDIHIVAAVERVLGVPFGTLGRLITEREVKA